MKELILTIYILAIMVFGMLVGFNIGDWLLEPQSTQEYECTQ